LISCFEFKIRHLIVPITSIEGYLILLLIEDIRKISGKKGEMSETKRKRDVTKMKHMQRIQRQE
jgi:hypothetical protein